MTTMTTKIQNKFDVEMATKLASEIWYKGKYTGMKLKDFLFQGCSNDIEKTENLRSFTTSYNRNFFPPFETLL